MSEVGALSGRQRFLSVGTASTSQLHSGPGTGEAGAGQVREGGTAVNLFFSTGNYSVVWFPQQPL